MASRRWSACAIAAPESLLALRSISDYRQRMTRGDIEQLRRFNRTVAEGIGALEDRFLGRARPLGEAHLLWEIGETGAELRELRGRLGLDSGYLSRLFRSLERQRLVRVEVDA